MTGHSHETVDGEDIRTALRAFLDRHASPAHVRELVEAEATYDRGLWRRLCRELGIAAMCLPVDHGGQEASAGYQMVALEELGRALTPSPYFGSIAWGSSALIASGDVELCREVLPLIGTGDRTVTVAAAEDPLDSDLEAISVSARELQGRWHVTGEKPWVIDGDADLLLVLASTDLGPSLFLVDRATAGVRLTSVSALDRTRPLSHLALESAEGRLVGAVGEGRTTVIAAQRRASIALAAEQLGGARRTLESAVSYAKRREQFGRPIGSFQALQHLMADQLVANESLAALVRHGARALDEDSPELTQVAHLCQAIASEVHLAAASLNVHVHGGLGFSWDHDAQLYFKRAAADRQLLGAPGYHQESLARLLLRGTKPTEVG